jgi:hypothetical protein
VLPGQESKILHLELPPIDDGGMKLDQGGTPPPQKPTPTDVEALVFGGNEPPPAKEAAEMRKHVRLITGANGQPTSDGRVVDADLRFAGLKKSCAYLVWSLFDARADRAVPYEWLTERPGLKFKVSKDPADGSTALWIPLPRESGPFYVIAAVYDRDGNRLARDQSPSFN